MLYQLEDRLHLCLRAHKIKYIWSDFHFTVDVKVKILHFRDENKSWWPWFLNCALFGKYFMFFFHDFLLTFYSFLTKSYTFVNYFITYFYFYFHFCPYLGNKWFIDLNILLNWTVKFICLNHLFSVLLEMVGMAWPCSMYLKNKLWNINISIDKINKINLDSANY